MAGEGENPKIQRRLAAIVVADIAGYSALLGGDEEATIRDLNAHQVVIWPMIGEYGGRIITTAGDGFLAEFSSVLTAVKCALAIQQVMAERNAPVDPAKRMQFRIGINQGDVVFDDTFVHGIGVNIAGRLEDMAEPGGICISGKVHEEITGKIDAEFEDCGQQSLKNIAQSVRVYRISPSHRNNPASATRSPPTSSDKPRIAERHHRRLAAILAADIARYSAIMGADEAGTVRDLKAHQAAVLPLISEHGGRIIDTAGDGILAEFRSVVNAVECAVSLQKTMAERNADILPDRQMKFRVGVNLGDVIYDDARVYGDGVNIAARLESIADPGGICVSGAVYEQVQKKLPLAFTDLGAQSVKNISDPVRVYRINRECLVSLKS
jgi:class 3 adenylate cyclase